VKRKTCVSKLAFGGIVDKTMEENNIQPPFQPIFKRTDFKGMFIFSKLVFEDIMEEFIIASVSFNTHTLNFYYCKLAINERVGDRWHNFRQVELHSCLEAKNVHNKLNLHLCW